MLIFKVKNQVLVTSHAWQVLVIDLILLEASFVFDSVCSMPLIWRVGINLLSHTFFLRLSIVFVLNNSVVKFKIRKIFLSSVLCPFINTNMNINIFPSSNNFAGLYLEPNHLCLMFLEQHNPLNLQIHVLIYSISTWFLLFYLWIYFLSQFFASNTLVVLAFLCLNSIFVNFSIIILTWSFFILFDFLMPIHHLPFSVAVIIFLFLNYVPLTFVNFLGKLEQSLLLHLSFNPSTSILGFLFVSFF